MPKSPGQDELDTLREIAAIAKKLSKCSIESYMALGSENHPPKHHSEWDEYDEMVLPLWKDLDARLKYLEL